MKTAKEVVSHVLEFLGVLVALYLSWLLARWMNPHESGESFWSVQAWIAGAEAAVGLFLLALTIGYVFRKSIEKALHAWGNWQ